MSDELDKEQKTEEATPQRARKLRDEGKTGASPDVGAAAVLLAGVGSLSLLRADILGSIEAFSKASFSFSRELVFAERLEALGRCYAVAALPVLGVTFAAAIAAGLAQTGGFFNPGLAAPKLDRIFSSRSWTAVLPSKHSLLEVGKATLKMGIVGTAAGSVAIDAVTRFRALPMAPVDVIGQELLHFAGSVVFHGAFAFALLAGLELFLAKRKLATDSRMSRQEVRDEHKQEEGDPKIRGRRRMRARELVRSMRASRLADATVVVTNPTHFAVALQYEPGKHAVPVVCAKGVDDEALRIRREARKHGVPIVENRPLARSLHAGTKVAGPIPADLYAATAEVIVYVLRLRAGRVG